MSEVVKFTGITRHNLDTAMVRSEAKDECPDTLICIGYDQDGEFYFSSSIADGGDILWLLEIAKKRLLEIGDPNA